MRWSGAAFVLLALGAGSFAQEAKVDQSSQRKLVILPVPEPGVLAISLDPDYRVFLPGEAFKLAVTNLSSATLRGVEFYVYREDTGEVAWPPEGADVRTDLPPGGSRSVPLNARPTPGYSYGAYSYGGEPGTLLQAGRYHVTAIGRFGRFRIVNHLPFEVVATDHLKKRYVRNASTGRWDALMSDPYASQECVGFGITKVSAKYRKGETIRAFVINKTQREASVAWKLTGKVGVNRKEFLSDVERLAPGARALVEIPANGLGLGLRRLEATFSFAKDSGYLPLTDWIQIKVQ